MTGCELFKFDKSTLNHTARSLIVRAKERLRMPPKDIRGIGFAELLQELSRFSGEGD